MPVMNAASSVSDTHHLYRIRTGRARTSQPCRPIADDTDGGCGLGEGRCTVRSWRSAAGAGVLPLLFAVLVAVVTAPFLTPAGREFAYALIGLASALAIFTGIRR